MTYRALRIAGLEKDLVLSRVTETKFQHTEKKSIMIEELPDGTWRIIYSGQFGDIAKLNKISMVKPAKPIAPKNEPAQVVLEGWDLTIPVNKVIETNNPSGQIWLLPRDGKYELLHSKDIPKMRDGFEITIVREN